jgi:hypothetical protein
VNAADARAVVAELGLTEHVRELALAMPPLSDDQIERLRRILNAPNAQRDGACAAPSRCNDAQPCHRTGTNRDDHTVPL